MFNPDVQAFLKQLREKWPSCPNQAMACSAYLGAVAQGMSPSDCDQLIEFLKKIKLANFSIGEYYGKYGPSIRSQEVLSAFFSRLGDVEAPFLKESVDWSPGELRAKFVEYIDSLRKKVGTGEQSHPPPEKKDLNYYFHQLLAAKGPKFMDDIPKVSQLATLAGVKGLAAFTRDAMNSLGIQDSTLQELYESHATYRGKEFPDWIVELIANSDVDNYIVAYAYELIGLYLLNGKK